MRACLLAVRMSCAADALNTVHFDDALGLKVGVVIRQRAVLDTALLCARLPMSAVRVVITRCAAVLPA